MDALFFMGGAALVLLCRFAQIFSDDRRETAIRRADVAARNAYYAERDPHCDGCASKDGREPDRPVMRCARCMNSVASWVGDPLFGFDFEKYKEPQ